MSVTAPDAGNQKPVAGWLRTQGMVRPFDSLTLILKLASRGNGPEQDLRPDGHRDRPAWFWGPWGSDFIIAAQRHVSRSDLMEINRGRGRIWEKLAELLDFQERRTAMVIERAALATIFVAGWIALGGPAFAADLNGSWATDASVCNKVFVRKGDTISFAQDSDQFGGGFIMEGNRIRGQMQTCTIRTRKEEGNLVHFLASCASDIMAANVQFSARIIDDNTIARIFPGMPEELSIKYSRCPK